MLKYPTLQQKKHVYSLVQKVVLVYKANFALRDNWGVDFKGVATWVTGGLLLLSRLGGRGFGNQLHPPPAFFTSGSAHFELQKPTGHGHYVHVFYSLWFFLANRFNRDINHLIKMFDNSGNLLTYEQFLSTYSFPVQYNLIQLLKLFLGHFVNLSKVIFVIILYLWQTQD